MKNRHLINLVIPIACLLLGGAAGFIIHSMWFSKDTSGEVIVQDREGSYQFINPLLECDASKTASRNRELAPFKDNVEEFIKTKDPSESVSVYFRELNDGIWFSIGDTQRFTLASLRKIPMLIAFLKQAENDKRVLSRKLRYQLSSDYNATQSFKPSHVMTVGQEYTIEELLYRMIAYSDNNAFTLLASVVDRGELERVYRVFNIKIPETDTTEEFRSAVTFASFFRVLYNATYLNREMSESALRLLTMSEFRDCIVAGVPPDLPVAHKFGEHWEQGSNVKELHDCGIVYYPQHPYLLCVMSKGDNFQSLTEDISSISRIVYTRVDEQHSSHQP